MDTKTKFAKVYYSPRATGKALPPLKNCPRPLRSRKILQKSGRSSRRFGKSTSPHRGTFLDQNSMFPHPTRSTKRTFFFCLPVGTKFSNTRWPLPTWPAATKRPNPWPRKNSDEVAQAFQKIYNARLWSGLKWCMFTPGASSWAMLPKKWKITKHIFGACLLTFTMTRPLLNVSTAPLLSACSATSAPLKCNFLRASSLLRQWKGYPKLFRLWTTR